MQDASNRLYLCLMLKLAPVVTEGWAVGVQGSRFLDVYVPEFGVQCRVHAEEAAPPGCLDWIWNSVSRCALPLFPCARWGGTPIYLLH